MRWVDTKNIIGLPDGQQIKIYDPENRRDQAELFRKSMLPGFKQVEERQWDKKPYGSLPGIPVGREARPNIWLTKDDIQDAIKLGHEKKLFPLYAQRETWMPKGKRYNQNGLGYCWTWGGTAAFLDMMAVHRWPMIPLAPVSMGYLVGWKNQGNYLESWIRGAMDDGICPAMDGNINSHQNSSSLWGQFDKYRKFFQLDEAIELNTRSGDLITTLECLTCLYYGISIYHAYNWWSHALSICAMFWDTTKLNGVIWGVRNSHNDPDIIFLDGSKGSPDEAYGLVSPRTPDEDFPQELLDIQIRYSGADYKQTSDGLWVPGTAA